MNLFKKITQEIAIKWYLTIDRTGTLYYMLKSLNFWFRAAYYISSILFMFFMFSIMKSYLPLVKYNLESFYEFISYTVIIGSSLVITYESIYKLDIENILEKKSLEQKRIKQGKLEGWRLRNMSFIKRLFVYIAVFAFLVFGLQFLIMAAFIQHFPSPTLSDIQMLENSYRDVLNYLSLVFVFVFLTLEYFTQKAIKRREHD